MSDPDYKAILENYVRAVLADDLVIGLRCATDDYDGPEEDLPALQEIVRRMYQRYFNDDRDPFAIPWVRNPP